MKKFKIYSYNKERNKCNFKGKSANVLKDQLIKIKGLICYLCNKEQSHKKFLELEHKIPIEIGGEIFCASNLDLACSKCHLKKTLIDKEVIKIIKHSGLIIEGLGSLVPLEDIRKIYSEWFNIIKDCKEKYEAWYNGSPDIDYEQIIDNSNREVENGEERK